MLFTHMHVHVRTSVHTRTEGVSAAGWLLTRMCTHAEYSWMSTGICTYMYVYLCDISICTCMYVYLCEY